MRSQWEKTIDNVDNVVMKERRLTNDELMTIEEMKKVLIN